MLLFWIIILLGVVDLFCISIILLFGIFLNSVLIVYFMIMMIIEGIDCGLCVVIWKIVIIILFVLVILIEMVIGYGFWMKMVLVCEIIRGCFV